MLDGPVVALLAKFAKAAAVSAAVVLLLAVKVSPPIVRLSPLNKAGKLERDALSVTRGVDDDPWVVVTAGGITGFW